MLVTTRHKNKAAKAEQLRQRLTLILGGKCVFCGNPRTLTFDCIKPTGDKHHRMNSLDRMYYYFEQARRGNVQLLCNVCNVRKGRRAQPKYIYGQVVEASVLQQNLA